MFFKGSLRAFFTSSFESQTRALDNSEPSGSSRTTVTSFLCATSQYFLTSTSLKR